MLKRMTGLMLVMALCLGLSSCGTASEPQQTTVQTAAPETTVAETAGEPAVDKSAMDYETLSAYVYEQALGEFYEAYEAAKQVQDVPQRYAQMAVAEANLPDGFGSW